VGGRTHVSPDVRRKRERHARSKAPKSAGAISLKKDTPMIASVRGRQRDRGGRAEAAVRARQRGDAELCTR
jgi:hypothetical protein